MWTLAGGGSNASSIKNMSLMKGHSTVATRNRVRLILYWFTNEKQAHSPVPSPKKGQFCLLTCKFFPLPITKQEFMLHSSRAFSCHSMMKLSVTSVLMAHKIFLSWSIEISCKSPCLAQLTSSDFASTPLVPCHVQKSHRRTCTEEASSVNQPHKCLDHHILTDSHKRQPHANEFVALFQGCIIRCVDLRCGAPPQQQTVIVDAGSSATAFPCLECQGCGDSTCHADQSHVETNSSTFLK